MFRNLKLLLGLGLVLGLIPATVEAGGKPKPPPTCPACSIVFQQVTPYHHTDLMLVKEDGSSMTLLLAGGRFIDQQRPSWAPDGTWISFTSNMNDEFALWLIRNDGTGLTKLTPGALNTTPAWRPVPSAGGYWLVFPGSCAPPGYKQQLCAMEVSLGNPILASDVHCLTCGLGIVSGDYWTTSAWSRDGMHLVGTVTSLTVETGRRYDIYMFDIGFDAQGKPYVTAWWLFLPIPADWHITEGAWAHWSDSLVAVSDGIPYRFDIDFAARTFTSIPLAPGFAASFYQMSWSSDDSKFLGVLTNTAGGVNDGICAITPGSPPTVTRVAPYGKNLPTYPDWKPPVP